MHFSINISWQRWKAAWVALIVFAAMALDPRVACANTTVRFHTNFGLIDVELFDTAAPATVANFLNYATTGRYRDVIIHRLAPDFVIQGGAFTSTYDIMPTDAPVVNEPNHTNIRGTIAMAKLGGDPDSATNQWFFNLADNSSNLDAQNGGFTVFGRVIGNGMNVIDSVTDVAYGDFGYDEFGINPRIDVSALPVRNYEQGEYSAAIRPDETHLLIVKDVSTVGSTFSPNQNQSNMFDVTNSGNVLPRDLIALVDELSRSGEHALPDNFVGPLFVDVDGNRRLNNSDVNMLMRYLNETNTTQLNSSAGGLLAMAEFSDTPYELAAMVPSSGEFGVLVVPEPSSWLLGLLAAAGLGLLRRRCRMLRNI